MGLPSKEAFSTNLAAVCAHRPSVSAVCRSVGINRQQFGRYLSGTSIPSPHNLMRIAREFGVAPEDFFLEPSDFEERYALSELSDTSRSEGRLSTLMRRAFPGDTLRLRRLHGYYKSHFLVPYHGSIVMRALVSIYQKEGLFFSKSIERGGEFQSGRMISKYDGLVSLINDRLFVLEFESVAQDALVETVLSVPRRHEVRQLFGMTFGITSELNGRPFASPIVWTFLGQTIDVRAAMRDTGPLPLDSPKVSSRIRRALMASHGVAYTHAFPGA